MMEEMKSVKQEKKKKPTDVASNVCVIFLPEFMLIIGPFQSCTAGLPGLEAQKLEAVPRPCPHSVRRSRWEPTGHHFIPPKPPTVLWL